MAKTWKRMSAIFLSAILLAGTIGCSIKPENPIEELPEAEQNSTVTVWAWDDKFNVLAVEEAANIYQEINPEAVVYVETIAQNDVLQKVRTGLSAGSYDTLPDIFLTEDSKIRNFLVNYPGEIKRLDDRIDMSRFMDYKLEAMTLGNNIYGVPFDSGVAVTFYRTDYLQQAGYTASDMENITWERYIEIGKTVLQKTGKEMIVLEPGDLSQIRIMMQSAGEWYVQPDGQTLSIQDNVALRQAIEVYQKMLEAEIAKPVPDWGSYLLAMNEGEVAATVIGCWMAASIQKQQDQSGKWAVAPVPRLGENPRSVNASNVGGCSWYVLANRPNAELAVDFLANTFATSDDLMNTLAEKISLVSTLKSASDMPNYHMKSEFFSGQEIFTRFSEWTQNIPSVNYGLATFEIEMFVAEALEKIMGKTATVDQALEEAQKEAEALFK